MEDIGLKVIDHAVLAIFSMYSESGSPREFSEDLLNYSKAFEVLL